MRKDQKQRTSVFSEYENNENDSITSRQLEFWLKQTAPTSQPRPPNEWTLMSTNSIFEQDEHPLMRNQTFQSINKENDMTAFNSVRQPFQNTSSVLKSKSYLNAMTDLQSKVKQLEQENGNLKNILRNLKEDKNRSISESNVLNEELKTRITSLEPKAKKLEQMVRQNKKLRDWKQQNIKKIKIMEKMIKQHGETVTTYERQISKLKDVERSFSKMGEESDVKFQQQLKTIEKLKAQNIKLMEKNKMLEDMKEKSTTAVLEKYSKSVNQIQQLTLQNDHLRRQMGILRAKAEQKLRSVQEQTRKQRQQLLAINERVKQENIQKKELITTLNTQLTYFKENYEKANQSLITCIKNHSKEIQQLKERQMMELKMKKQSQQSQIICPQPHRQQIQLNKESIIKSNEHQITNKNQIQSQLHFQEFNSIQPEQIDESPSYETRSAIDKEAKKSIYSKSQIKNQIVDTLSQQNYHQGYSTQKIKQMILKKPKHKSQEIKDKTNQKSKQKSQQKMRSKEKSKERSREKSRDIDRLNQGISHEHSFILKSHQPLTHKEIPEHMYYTEDPGFDSTNNKKNVPYYWESNEVADFGISQRGNPNYCTHNPITTQFTLEQALLNEINRQGIRLLEAQLSYMESDRNENLTPSEKAEHIGRLKQINEQIRINFEKKMELMQKMNKD